jgi:HAD superfamily hydrolase (TIGR01509 family)
MNASAVLFDLDGTLVNSNEFHVEAWRRVFNDAGHDIPVETIRGQIGKGGDNLVPTLLPQLDTDARQSLATAQGDLYKRDYLDRVQPFPCARELVERVHREGVAPVLASSAGSQELEHYLDLLGIRTLVAAIAGKDDVEHSKPDPDVFAAALDQTGVAPEAALAIGDTPYDAIAAGRCGVRTIGVLSGGFPEDALRAAGAVAVYADVAAILAGYAASPLASLSKAGAPA